MDALLLWQDAFIFTALVLGLLFLNYLTCVSDSSTICIFSVTAVEGLRKRPLIVFDGSSTSTSIKVKKTENGATDRLKPPPAGSITNTVRRLSAPSNASTYISASSLSEDAKLEVRNNEAKQNNISKTNSSVLVNLKTHPLSPVAGTTVVKLKRSVPKDESDLPVRMVNVLFNSLSKLEGAKGSPLQKLPGLFYVIREYLQTGKVVAGLGEMEGKGNEVLVYGKLLYKRQLCRKRACLCKMNR